MIASLIGLRLLIQIYFYSHCSIKWNNKINRNKNNIANITTFNHVKFKFYQVDTLSKTKTKKRNSRIHEKKHTNLFTE